MRGVAGGQREWWWKGVTGQKKEREGKKQEMALGGLQKKQGLHDKSRGNVSEKVKLQKSKEKEWGREEKEDKRWRFNELSLTVGDMRSSPRLKRIKGEVCTFIQALKQFPHAGWGKPGVVFRLETAIPNVHTCTVNLWNKKWSLRVMKMLHLTAAYPLIAAQTDFSLSSLRNDVLYSYSLHSKFLSGASWSCGNKGQSPSRDVTARHPLPPKFNSKAHIWISAGQTPSSSLLPWTGNTTQHCR